MHRVAIIGSGQIGARHLQALAKSDYPLCVGIVDRSASALETAKKRYNEIPENSNILDVSYHQTLKSLNHKIDLCIIATTAGSRAEVTKALLEKTSVRYILFEKVLFQNLSDYREISGLIKKQGVDAWVNCPRRVYPFYNELKSMLSGVKRISFVVSGGEWGLACNSIHLIDLIAFLISDSCYTINTALLDNKLINSKRGGYSEITGALHGRFSKNSDFLFRSVSGSTVPHSILIAGTGVTVFVDEHSGKAFVSKEKGKTLWEEMEFSVPYQSELTHHIVKNIINTGKCGLTPFDESVELHIPLIKGLLEYLSLVQERTVVTCPIT